MVTNKVISYTLHEKIPLQNFTVKVKLRKDADYTKVNFTPTLQKLK